MDLATRLTVIRRVPLFGGLTADDLAVIAREAREQRLKKDDQPFRQGEPATRHYVIGWGRLRLDQVTRDGQNLVLRFMGEGELLGSVAVLREVPYPATPTAIEDCLLLSWSAGGFAELMERCPRISLNAVKIIGGRLEDLQERLRELATQRVERRIAATLLRMARQSGRRVAGGVEIPFVLSRNELAELTATTLHTVSRTLAAWEQEGILSGKRAAHLVIAKPHRLVEIAEQA
jgi:CRP-like cAMP-binding protein